MPDKEPPPVPEPALKTYLHLAAYGLPALAFVIFSTVVVLPRVVAVWKHAGSQVKHAEWWILGLCEIFTFNFNYFLGGAVVVFILLEKCWARWPSIRSRVVRTFTWILTMLVLAGITWTSVTAMLVAPMVLNQHKKAEVSRCDQTGTDCSTQSGTSGRSPLASQRSDASTHALRHRTRLCWRAPGAVSQPRG